MFTPLPEKVRAGIYVCKRQDFVPSKMLTFFDFR
jgi:hypothetical protein